MSKTAQKPSDSDSAHNVRPESSSSLALKPKEELATTKNAYDEALKTLTGARSSLAAGEKEQALEQSRYAVTLFQDIIKKEEWSIQLYDYMLDAQRIATDAELGIKERDDRMKQVRICVYVNICMHMVCMHIFAYVEAVGTVCVCMYVYVYHDTTAGKLYTNIYLLRECSTCSLIYMYIYIMYIYVSPHQKKTYMLYVCIYTNISLQGSGFKTQRKWLPRSITCMCVCMYVIRTNPRAHTHACM